MNCGFWSRGDTVSLANGLKIETAENIDAVKSFCYCLDPRTNNHIKLAGMLSCGLQMDWAPNQILTKMWRVSAHNSPYIWAAMRKKILLSACIVYVSNRCKYRQLPSNHQFFLLCDPPLASHLRHEKLNTMRTHCCLKQVYHYCIVWTHPEVSQWHWQWRFHCETRLRNWWGSGKWNWAAQNGWHKVF